MIVLFHGERFLGFRVDRLPTVINQNPSASFFKFRIPSQFLRQPLLCSRIVFKHWWPSLDGAGPHSQPLMLAAETINFKRASKLLQFQASHEELVSRSCPERPTPRERETSSRERVERPGLDSPRRADSFWKLDKTPAVMRKPKSATKGFCRLTK